MAYSAAKHLHVAAVLVSWALFFLRGIWMILDSPRLGARWVRIVPHVNDTILLVAAIYLATFFGMQPWIIAKLAALVAYILIGMVAITRGPTKPVRVAAWLLGQAVFVYIVAVAIRKDPLPFVGGALVG
ncbi:MAG TPA: SirB2 family protein [Burkholderiales bacterium]|nr:SirB2 family protein [Burkholderiales bacterium]